MSEDTRPAMELPSTFFSHQRLRLKATSSAVKSSPLFQVTPLRTWSTYSVASSLTSQLSRSHVLEGEVAGVEHQRLGELAGHVAHFRPVEGARVVDPAHVHGNLQDAALLGLFSPRFARRGKAEKAVGGGGRGAEGGRHGEEFAAVDPAFSRGFRPFPDLGFSGLPLMVSSCSVIAALP